MIPYGSEQNYKPVLYFVRIRGSTAYGVHNFFTYLLKYEGASLWNKLNLSFWSAGNALEFKDVLMV